jgi:glucoamylase
MEFLFVLLFSLLSPQAHASDAFGKPGMVPTWSKAKKVQVGTYYEGYTGKVRSNIWFSNVDGVLSEVYYPNIDRPQIKDSQFLIVDRSRNTLWEERKSLVHKVQVVSPSLVKMINTERTGRFQISHTFFTLKNRSAVVDEVEVTMNEDGLSLYLLVNPHINNSGYYDNAFLSDGDLFFYEGDTQLRVSTTAGFSQRSMGFVGFSDGFQDLRKDGVMDYNFTEAMGGNVAGTGKINIPARRGKYKFYVIYDFTNSQAIKLMNLGQAKIDYNNSWNNYFNKVNVPSGMTQEEKRLYLRSLYTVKVHEDKLNPGSMAASLSKPWGDDIKEDGNTFTGGYHLTWPRDLFHKALALLVAGDMQTPYMSLRFLKQIQYKSGVWNYGERIIPKKGAFPQNVWTNGKEYWGGLQLDQVGYPIQLVYHMFKRSNPSQKNTLLNEFGGMVFQAAEFIRKFGPWTGQERWEENFGISPSTFSVAAAAMFMASELLQNPVYGKVAKGWLTKPNDNIHTWTFTNTGVYGDGKYYLRVAGCGGYGAIWNPNSDQQCHIANSSMKKNQKLILDQGFLKLALMGLVPADDERILSSVEKVNKHISVKTPVGRGWYRYSFDSYGYGEGNKGRLWPLLNGEHGRYYIELYRAGFSSWSEAKRGVNNMIGSFLGFANEGLMIPEQVFEKDGSGTGAATPLAWSHAEYIKLLWSRHHKANVENIWSLYE